MTADELFLHAVELVQAGKLRDALATARAILRIHLGHEGALDLIDELEVRIATDASVGPSDQGWQIGSVIERRWEVFGQAAGGMGQIYFVRDLEWDELSMAVKSFRPDPQWKEPQRQFAEGLFRREVEVWIDLGGHPAIVTGYYATEVLGTLRFFMEFVAGHTLEVELKAGALASKRALDVSIQIASALDHVHTRGVAHRDLKPLNCLVTHAGELRITDFGLAGSRRATDADGPAIGSPPYMAPEQWESLDQAGTPADVYALGVTLYRMLAGLQPFEPDLEAMERRGAVLGPRLMRLRGGNPQPSMLYPLLHREATPAPLDPNGRLDPELERLVLACLNKNPAERPTSRELVRSLVHLYGVETGTVYPRPLPDATASTEESESNRAVSHHALGHRAQAIDILDRCLARDPAALYSWVNRSVVSLEADETKPAIVATELSLRRDAHPAAFVADRALRRFADRLASWRIALDAPITEIVGKSDGVAIVIAGHELVVWRPESELQRIAGDATWTCLAAGEVIAAGDLHGRVTILDLRGSPIVSFSGHDHPIAFVSLVPDGRGLISVGADGALRLWDRLHPAQPIREFQLDVLPRAVLTDPWFPRLVHLALGDRLVAFDLMELRERGELRESPGTAVRSAMLSREGQWLVINGNLLLREGEYTTPVYQPSSKARSGIRLSALSPDGSLIACVGAAESGVHEVRRFDLLVEQLGAERVEEIATNGQQPLLCLPLGITSIAFCSAEQLVTGDADGGVSRWSCRIPNGAWSPVVARPLASSTRSSIERDIADLVARIDADDVAAALTLGEHFERTPALATSASARALDSLGRRYGVRTGVRRIVPCSFLRTDGPISALALDAEHAWIGRADGHVVAHRLVDRALISDASRHIGAVTGLWFDAEGIGSSGADGMMRWSNTCIPAHPGGVLSIDTADTVIATCGADGMLRVWRSHTLVLEDDTKSNTVALSPDAGLVMDGVTLREVADGSRVRTVAAHRVTCLRFLGDARRIALGTAEGQLHVASTADGGVDAITAHEGPVLALTSSMDGRLLISAGADGKVRVWNARDLRLSGTVGHAAPVHALALSSDGTMISGDADGILRMWRIDSTWEHAEDLVGATTSLFDVDLLIDASSDLARCARRPTLGGTHRESPVACEHAMAQIVEMTLGRTTDRVAHPVQRAAWVDPDLAHELVRRGARPAPPIPEATQRPHPPAFEPPAPPRPIARETRSLAELWDAGEIAMTAEAAVRMQALGIADHARSPCGFAPPRGSVCRQPCDVSCGGCGDTRCSEPWHTFGAFFVLRGGSAFAKDGDKIHFYCNACRAHVCTRCLGVDEELPCDAARIELHLFPCPRCSERVHVLIERGVDLVGAIASLRALPVR